MSSFTWRKGAVAVLAVSLWGGAPLTGVAEAAPAKATRSTKVAVKVAKPAPGATRAGVNVTVKASAQAGRSKRRVTLQRRTGGRWVAVSGVKARRTSSTGKVTFTVPRTPSRTTWRTKVSAKGAYRGVTRSFTVAARRPAPTPTVRPTPTPSATPSTSPRPLPSPAPPPPPIPMPTASPTVLPTTGPTPAPTAGPSGVPTTAPDGNGITATFTSATQNAGLMTRFNGSGTVTGAPAGRTVVLESRNGADWTEVGRTATTTGGAWAAEVRGDWLFTLPVRARALATSGAAEASTTPVTLSTAPFWTPSWTSAGAPSHPVSVPLVRWNPCDGAITYQLNLTKSAGVTPALVAASLTEITLGTGLRFEYLGETTRHAFSAADSSDLADGSRASGADLLISFSDDLDTDSAEGPDFSSTSTTVGYGGVSYWTNSRYDIFGQVKQVIYGSVALNVEFNDSHLDPAGRVLDSVVKHEVGHAVGLNHASSAHADQIMAPYVSRNPVEHWGAGDLVGLANVGAAKGCTRTSPPLGLSALRTPALSAPALGEPEIGFIGYEDKALPEDR